MAFMRRIGRHFIEAVPGGTSETVRQYLEHLDDYAILNAIGETFRGSKRDGIPGAAIQRRAMQLADITGRQFSLTHGEHYAAAGDLFLSVKPAAHGTGADYAPTGWLITESRPDGIIGHQADRTYAATWPDVLAYVRAHFPHEAEVVTDDEIEGAVNAVFLDGFGETVGDLSDGDMWAGVTELNGDWYGREENSYGQRMTYRFGNESRAMQWLYSVETTPANLY